MAIQRRLAAILAADVVGYSRLMGEDEEGTRSKFNNLMGSVVSPAVETHRGRLVKTMGDGFLVEFQSVLDAVQCAVDVQQGAAAAGANESEERRMLLRIAIHLGDVIVEGDDIHGDGVNIAARLEGLAEPGGIWVSDMVHAGVRGKLALEFVDLGDQLLKNIAQPIQAFRIELENSEARAGAASNAMFRRPAVAVLPFENLSGDPEQEYFADGLTEDIITALSLWKSFPVIARNSTYTFKGHSPDIRKVGEELGARYVIEGSVRKSADRVRVTAQLIDAETGHHIWAERYDRDLVGFFELQDEIAQGIAGVVAPELERSETLRHANAQPMDLEAWDCCIRGRSLLAAFDPSENKRARELFERAIELEPTSSQAYAGLARSHYRDILLGASRDRDHSVGEALGAARRAVELDRTDSLAHMLLAIAHHYAGEHAASVSEAEFAVRLNPSNAQAYFTLGLHLSQMGRPAEGKRALDTGFRLNPYEPGNHIYFSMMAHAHFTAREYEEAIEWAAKAQQFKPEAREPHIIMAAALGALSRTAEAQKELSAAESNEHFVTLKGDWFDWQHQADNEHFLEALRKIGWEG